MMLRLVTATLIGTLASVGAEANERDTSAFFDRQRQIIDGQPPFEWPNLPPQQAGIDPALLQALDQQVRGLDYGFVKSVVIVRNNAIVHERYFNGFEADDLMPIYSVTKSWASALVGIAIDRGEIPAVDAAISEVLLDYEDVFSDNRRKRKIQVHDLLTMRHGLEWDEWSTFFTDPVNPVNQMINSPDWWRYVLERPASAQPGSVFRYSTGVSNLLGGLIFSATSKDAIQYAREQLFGPMDIEDYYVEVDISGQPQGTGITEFPEGQTPTGHGWWLRARDLAKLGQLYLHRGRWRGRQLVGEAWVDASFQAYSDAQSDPDVFGEDLSYGYQWWNMNAPGPNGPVPIHFAWGYGSQHIFVVPQLDLVIVSTADNGSWEGPTMITAVRDFIVPGILAGPNAPNRAPAASLRRPREFSSPARPQHAIRRPASETFPY